jgi:soluble lytic murein transglycosylase-like protein
MAWGGREYRKNLQSPGTSPTAAGAAESSMRHKPILQFGPAASVLAAVWMCLALPARAEKIVLVNDGHGNMVYVNVENPPASAQQAGNASLKRVTPPAEIEKLVQQTAQRYNVDPKLVRAVIQVESDYNPQALSNKGAMGLMQLIPETAERYGVRNPYNPKQNIIGGVSYLKHLLKMFNGDLDLSLAAYNAGENAVLRGGGVPRIPETVNYVRKVRSLYDGGKNSAAQGTKSAPTNPVTIYRYVDAAGVVHYTDGGDL